MHLYAEGKHAFGLASYKISDNPLATVGRGLAADHRDDFEVGTAAGVDLDVTRQQGG